MTAEPPVTLCIVNYNGADHLPRALQSARDQNWRFAELLLIDNASTDGSPELAATLGPEARTIRLPENRGPGAARNAGFRAATNDLILFQDNDVRLLSDTAAMLVGHLRNQPQALLVAPRVLYAEDPETVQYDSADCHFLGLMATRNADTRADALDTAPADTSSMVSACFLIDRTRWQGDALFDESFAFNLEDHDFGVRARLLGHTLRIEPRALVHHGSGTPGLSWRPGQTAGEKRLLCLTLNRWIVISKCYARRTVVLLFPALVLFELMQLAWHIGNGSFHVWWRAVRAYRQALPRVRVERKDWQRRRQVSDRDVLRDRPLPLTSAVRGSVLAARLAAALDRLLRGYWHLVRHRV